MDGHTRPTSGEPCESRRALLGRSLPYIANGLFVSAFGFVVGLLLLDFSLSPETIPALAVVVLVTCIACTALGLLLGSIGLRARDVFFVSNLMYYLMLLFCGVNIPLEALPGWMQTIGRALPLTHGIAAAREVAAGAGLSDVSSLVGQEGLRAVIYMAAAYILFRLLEAEGRRRATLEIY